MGVLTLIFRRLPPTVLAICTMYSVMNAAMSASIFSESSKFAFDANRVTASTLRFKKAICSIA